MTLDKLEKNKDAVIVSVNCTDKPLRSHILDMGLTPGTEITMIKAAPMGDPLEIRIRGYSLTLRKADAALIEISQVHDMHNPRVSASRIKPMEHPGMGETRDRTYIPLRQGNILADKELISFALIGNQNCGKTTLFNQLTGSNQHVGNFPGVTVDRKDGQIKEQPGTLVTDLPGIYSMSPYSSEEIVTFDFLINDTPKGIINIIDATNIERNLYLTLQLMEMNIPMVIALNMMDEVRENGGTIMINNLEQLLGVPVVPISAAKNEGIGELVEHCLYVAKNRSCPGRVDFCNDNDNPAVHRCIHAIIHLISDHCESKGIPLRFAATKLVEDDNRILNMLGLNDNEKETLEHIIVEMEKECGYDRQAALADMRFSFIEKICRATVVKPHTSRESVRSAQIDRILTGRYTAIPSFLAIMAAIFYITFGPFGRFLSNTVESLVIRLTDMTDTFLTVYGINPIVKSMVIDGIFAGVGSVLSFLPVIVVLFFFLSILEDSGYMARVAFVMDKLLRKIGLSGRSFVPMLIGFGCTVPAIMATRTLPSERDRRMTILLTPFMSCSAKLPVYALFAAAFFKGYGALTLIALYLGGIVIAILYALLLKKTSLFKGEPVPFVMELPNYRMPSPKSVMQLISDKAKDFVSKAFTIIFTASVIIWFLQTFDMRLNVVSDSSDSLLAMIGSLLVPIFTPLGLGDWRMSTALITGFAAKESVVSTLTVLLNGRADMITEMFTTGTAAVFLTFALLYTPCVAAVAAVKRELGRKGAIVMVLIQCIIAWIVAFAVRLICLLIGV